MPMISRISFLNDDIPETEEVISRIRSETNIA